MRTVNDMYNYNKDKHRALLSNYNASFWLEYVNNYTIYDKLFRRMYLSFKYFLQEEDDEIDNITDNFISDVNALLRANSKRYEELYRVYVLPDDKYSLTDNYDVTETMDRDTTSYDSNTYGTRHDSASSTVGSQSNSVTSKVSPYNANDFYNDTHNDESLGSRSDSTSSTKGQQSDILDNTGTENYTMHRVGNIGVMTITDMLEKHKRFWTKYEFYTAIFNDICAELLLV